MARRVNESAGRTWEDDKLKYEAWKERKKTRTELMSKLDDAAKADRGLISREEPDEETRSAGTVVGGPADLSRSALSVLRTAEAAGWVVVVTLGSGERSVRRLGPLVRDVDGKAQKRTATYLIESVQTVALRMKHPDGRRAVVMWTNGKTPEAWCWAPGRTFPIRVKLMPGQNGSYTIREWLQGVPCETQIRKSKAGDEFGSTVLVRSLG